MGELGRCQLADVRTVIGIEDLEDRITLILGQLVRCPDMGDKFAHQLPPDGTFAVFRWHRAVRDRASDDCGAGYLASTRFGWRKELHLAVVNDEDAAVVFSAYVMRADEQEQSILADAQVVLPIQFTRRGGGAEERPDFTGTRGHVRHGATKAWREA